MGGYAGTSKSRDDLAASVGGKAGFEQAVKAEFARIMAAGNVTPNEAAAQAMRSIAGLQST